MNVSWKNSGTYTCHGRQYNEWEFQSDGVLNVSGKQCFSCDYLQRKNVGTYIGRVKLSEILGKGHNLHKKL